MNVLLCGDNGMYVGMEKVKQNKNVIKKKINTIIDDTADMIE